MPKDIRDVLGVTHVAGRYALTEKDFLNEGADQILALGSRVIKLWFYPGQGEPPQKMYPFHSDWPAVTNLVTCAQTPHYRAVFAKPFTTYILTTARIDRPQGYWRDGFTAADEAAETQAFYELAKHFLTTYRGTGKTFVLQHWEGDWLVRGHTDAKQDPAPAALANMARWLNARQAGVTQARQEVGEHGVDVYHAAEVNRVYDAMMADRPTVTNRVIPHTRVDLVSYSAYDTMYDHRDDPRLFRAALDFIARHAPGGKASVYVGEFGSPENETPPAVVEKIVTDTVQTALDWGCRYIVYWELYCNELKNPATPIPATKNEQMRGFWLIRPDGSKSWAWDYFHGLLSPVRPAATLTDFWDGKATWVSDATKIGSGFKFHFLSIIHEQDELWGYYIRNRRTPDGKLKMGIGRARSRDGVTWTDDGMVLDVGAPSAWDDRIASFPSVWKDGGTWYLVYEGAAEDIGFSPGEIGLATSTDGKTFVKHPNNPILRREQAGWECANIGTPSLYKENGIWYLFYHGYDNTLCQIGVASGKDLAKLAKSAANPVLPVTAGTVAWDTGTTGKRSSIVKEGDYYYFAFEGSTLPPFALSKWSSGLARTKKLTDAWTKLPANPVLAQTPGGMGNDGPEILRLGGKWYLYVRTFKTNMTERFRMEPKSPAAKP